MLKSANEPEIVASTEFSQPRTCWQTFIDVVTRPTVGPGAGWIIGGLIAFVVWLTIEYAPGSVTTGSDTIPVEAGYGTILVVAALALAVGWEPVISRWLGDGWPTWRIAWMAWLSRQEGWVRAPLTVAGRVLNEVHPLPSRILSFTDFMLARPLAVLSGTTLRRAHLRYAALFAWVIGGMLIGFVLPAPYSLIGVVTGIVAVTAVVRRWSWIERDRETFLTASTGALSRNCRAASRMTGMLSPPS